MSHSLFRGLEQVGLEESELEQQEAEQNRGRGDAPDGMGTCCYSCLPLGLGSDAAGRETELVELQLHSLEKEERQIETR